MLDKRLVSYRLLSLPEKAYTVKDIVKLTGVDVKEICKTMLVVEKKTKEPFIVIVPGNSKINMKKLDHLIGKSLRFARPYEIEEITGYRIGALPPYGHSRPITTYVDVSLMKNQKINFGTGVHNLGVEIKSRDLPRIMKFRTVDIT